MDKAGIELSVLSFNSPGIQPETNPDPAVQHARRVNDFQYADEPKLEEFWAKVAELDVPIYLHPRDPLPNQQRIYEGSPELLSAAWAYCGLRAGLVVKVLRKSAFTRERRGKKAVLF